mgnify:FL=1
MPKNNIMIQHTIWYSQHKKIDSRYGTMPWIAYLSNEVNRFIKHGRLAEIRYNKNGQAALFVNKIM